MSILLYMEMSPCNIKISFGQPMHTVSYAAILSWIQCSRGLYKMTY